MKIKKPELMSPAGDRVSLRAALDAGCDAVYFGIQGLNMRAGAENFSPADLKKIVRLCHAAGARAYLTLNSIIYENEISQVQKIISKAKQAEVDAVLCWDFAVIQEAQQQGVPVYISTQMSVANAESLLFFYRNFGIRRFVLARECSIEAIKKIRQKLGKSLGGKAKEIELEVFAHGALCVSVSGRCFLSQFLYNKSANRGECLQPCRRQYLVTDPVHGDSLAVGNNYILSPRDLCTLPFIENLIDAGITSFKIEGRNRSPEYVRTVTRAYRRAIDFYCDNRGKAGCKAGLTALKEELMASLARVYNRGFSSGFYLGRPLNDWHDREGSNATVRKEYAGVVTNFFKKPGVTEIRVESNEFSVGDEIMFQGPTTGVFSQIAASIEVEHRKVERAEKGLVVAVKTDRLTRQNDKVYIFK
ncbi:MAG: U32 family peptidase [Pseudomonadota bacterium]